MYRLVVDFEVNGDRGVGTIVSPDLVLRYARSFNWVVPEREALVLTTLSMEKTVIGINKK
jgi:hypothetical protein